MSLFALLLTAACSQATLRQERPERAVWQDPVPRRREHIDDYEPPRGRPYAHTRVRLQLFRDNVEFDELDLELDSSPDVNLRDFGRERTGFRGEFGSGQVGGFFQLFREDTESRTLFGPDMRSYGIGGGVAGAPAVGRTGPIEFAVPLRFEVDMVLGDEDTGTYDQDLFYLESRFEVGFGVRIFGLQASSGLIVDSLAGTFDSDDPANLASPGSAELSGTNIGAYVEALYKHPRVPLMASARAIVGDLQGIELTFGFAF